MKKYFLFLAIFATQYISSAQISKVEESPASVRLTISFPEVAASREKENFSLQIKNFAQKNFFVTKSGNRLQELRYLIAVPQDGAIDPKLTIYRKKNISSSSLSEKEKISPSVKVEGSTVLRGVKIISLIVQPFGTTNNNSLYILDSASIEIKFAQQVPLADKKNYSGEIFSAVENKIHAAALEKNFLSSRRGDKKKNSVLLGDESWYKPEQHYVRVATTRDGIAKIRASEIIAADNFFSGKENNFLQLWFKGREYPFAIRDNGDGMVSDGDEYYFAGRRAEGDSTWFDVETKEAVFYLAYAPGSAPARLGLFDEISSAEKNLEKVFSTFRIEKDSVYSLGDEPVGGNPDIERAKTIFRTEEIAGEGWYWHLLTSPRQEFSFHQILTPYRSESDSIEVRLRYHGGSDNLTYSPNHSLDFYLSNSPRGRFAFSGYESGDLIAKLPSKEFFAGNNKIAALSMKPAQDQPDYTNFIYFDYAQFSGAFKPFVYAGAGAFETGALQENSRLRVAGFSGSVAAFLDTAQKRISFRSGERGTTIRIGTRANNGAFTSFVVNDTVIIAPFNRDSTKGAHLIVIRSAGLTDRSQMFELSSADALSTLANDSFINPGNIVAFAYNSSAEMRSGLRELLANYGSSAIASYTQGASYVCVFRKGDKNSFRETIDNTSASLAEFFPHEDGNSYRAEITLAAGAGHTLMVADDGGTETASIAATSQSDLRSPSLETDLLIISHKNFLPAAQRLAEYRASRHKITTRVVDVENVFKEFGNGHHSPQAIKKFLRFASQNWQNGGIKYLMLMGDASRDPRFAQAAPKSTQIDFVPSFGRPVSDHWYGLLDESPDALPLSSILIGRIPVHSNDEADQFIDKLMEYDTLSPQPWMKKFLFVAGGATINEAESFCSEGDQVTRYIEDVSNFINGDQIASCKKQFYDPNVSNTQARDIVSVIDNGISWVNFIGHGSPNTMEIEGWKVENLNNTGRYFFLTTFSCQTNAFAEPEFSSLNEEYLLAHKKGAIGSIGTTGFGYTTFDPYLREMLFQAISMKRIRGFGEMIQYMKQEAYKSGGALPEGHNGIMQYTLLGDPLSHLPIDTLPDLYVQKSEIKPTLSKQRQFITSDLDRATFSFTMRNGGDYCQEKISVVITDEFAGQRDTVAKFSLSEGPGLFLTRSFTVPVKNKTGEHKLTVMLDPENTIHENNKLNNIAEISYSVFEPGLIALDPQPFWNIGVQNPRIRAINPFATSGKFTYEFQLVEKTDSVENILAEQKISDWNINEFVEWQPEISLRNNSSYIFRARQTDSATNRTSAWLSIPVTATATTVLDKVSWNQSTAGEFDANRLTNFTWSDEKKSLELSKTPLEAYILSSAGQGTSASLPTTIEVGNDIVLLHRTDNFGTNVVVYSPFDFSIRKKRRYDTREYPNNSAKHDGKSDKLIAFLRDSVKTGEYVLISFCDDALGGPIRNEKNISELRELIRALGSRYADSLTQERISFAMVGRKGAPVGSIPEKISMTGDSIGLRTKIVFSADSGSIETPWIGPAQSWRSISVSGILPQESVAQNIKIFGVKNTSLDETELFSGQNTGAKFFDTLSAEKFPYIRLVYSLKQHSASAEPYIQKISSEYTPLPEFSFINEKSQETTEFLKGDTAKISVVVRNISLRSALPPTKLTVNISEPGKNSVVNFDLPELAADQKHRDSLQIATNSETQLGKYSLQFSLVEAAEQYSFNNSWDYEYQLASDTTAPVVIITVDGDTVGNRTRIKTRKNPLIKITVLDNSRLPIDSTRIRFRIITGDDTYDNTAKEKFSSIIFRPLQSPGILRVEPRAEQEFIPMLTPDENILNVREVSDASGNTWKMPSDSVLYLVVSNETNISENTSSPNPYNPSEGDAKISFSYFGEENSSPAEIKIFSSQGRMVKNFQINAKIGLNEILWNGRDDSSTSVSSGMYYYRIVLTSNLEITSETGRIVIVR